MSTIRLKRSSESLQQCQMRLRSSMQDRKLSTATSPIELRCRPESCSSRWRQHSATLLHELTHSVGHEKRLARESITEAAAFGSAVYSKEELIAEMGGAYLCAEAGISNAVIANQAAYVAGWLTKLRDERKLLVHAAAQAQRACDYILNRTSCPE